MYPDQNAIFIYIDGSAKPTNPGPGGIGIVVEYPDHCGKQVERFKEGYRESTNNRMELRACVWGLELARKRYSEWRKLGVTKIVVVTDSRYVADHLSDALVWRNNNWKNGKGRPVENKDLWRELLAIQGKSPATIRWNLGKKTEVLKLVDSLAKSATKSSIMKLDSGYVSAQVSRAMTRGASELYPARGGVEIIRIYKHEAIQGESLIYFETFDFEENVFTEKYRAYASNAQRAKLHRWHWYQVKFNNIPEYPKIEESKEWIESLKINK